jgi:hypothetical protein
MSNILPRWSAESTDPLLTTDGLIVRGAEDEDDEEEDKNETDEDSENDADGYSE